MEIVTPRVVLHRAALTYPPCLAAAGKVLADHLPWAAATSRGRTWCSSMGHKLPLGCSYEAITSLPSWQDVVPFGAVLPCACHSNVL